MKSYDKTLTRLILILTKLSNNELPTMNELSEEFNVGLRTIQRDIYQRLIYFPIEKNKLSKLQFISGFTLDRCSLENDEMLLIYLAMSQVKTLSNNFENKIDNIFSKLLNPSFTSSYFIKPNSFEQINMKSAKLKSIEKAIKNYHISHIELENIKTTIRPYKIVSIDGIWYLFAKDLEDEKIKTYTVSKIDKFKTTKEVFDLQIDIDEVLSNVHSGWFEDGNNFKVIVSINSNVAHYFKAKKVLSTQEIIEHKDDGSIVVEFEVSHDEDIDNIVKAWLPDIKVIEPVRYKDKLHNELKQYLEK